MDGEFTANCRMFWKLREKMLTQEEKYATLVNEAPVYTTQTEVTELDEIIRYIRNAQALRAETDITIKQLNETKISILEIMKYFQIPPWRMLYSNFPGEFEFAVWVDEQDIVHAAIAKMLEPLPVDPNVIVIKLHDFYERPADKRSK